MMKIELKGLEVACVIGDRPEERLREQTLLVDAELDVCGAAGDSDSLEDTADYAAIAADVRAALASARCRLVERAAKIALDVCLADPRVLSARVRAAKSGSVAGLSSAAAVAEGSRVRPAAALPEYELAGIETIARGVCVRGGRVLLCRAKGADSTYLPGGHIEFGERGRDALVREMSEETGLEAVAGRFLGAVENSFVQRGRRHCEINLVYEMSIPENAAVAAKEDWIEFLWAPLDALDGANLLPEAMRAISSGDAAFAV